MLKDREFLRKASIAATKNIKERDYWLQKFSGVFTRTLFPYDITSSSKESQAPGKMEIEFSSHDFNHLETICKGSDYKTHMVITAVVIVLLNKYTSQDDITIGVPIYKQEHDGEFVNTVLGIRNQLKETMMFKELLLQVRNTLKEAIEHQNYPIETLVYQLKLPHPENEFPLFDVAVLLENIHDKAYIQHVKPNMIFSFRKTEKTIEGVLEYNQALFQESSITRIIYHFNHIFRSLLSNLEVKLSELGLLAESDRKRLFHLNNTRKEIPHGITLNDLFEEQVKEKPNHIALVCRDQELTYSGLDERAGQVAHYLYAQCRIQENETVGIILERSMNQIIAIMGVLKAGAAYVPIDSSFPYNRIKNILMDAGIRIIFSQKKCIKKLNRLQWECPNFNIFCLLDSKDAHSEEEEEKNELMNQKFWDLIGETATNDVTGGGWLCSYTGEPLSRKEMDEYGNNILKKLKPLLKKQMKVLEIGCGSGISMFRLAPMVKLYYASDLSPMIIERNRKMVEREKFKNIKLTTLAAHEIDDIDEKDFDLVIINSVIQCFHGHNYLRKVVNKSIKLLKEQGYLFFGDVLDLELKESLIQDLFEFEQENQGKGFKTKSDLSQELFLSRDFFLDLKAEQGEIQDVEFSGKIYTIENELTKFRYDTLIRIDKKCLNTDSCNQSGKKKYQQDLRHLLQYPALENPIPLDPSAIAYLVYTSGSTGKPKAVAVEHKSVVNLLMWRKQEYAFSTHNSVLQLFSYAFDGFVTSFFTPIISGSKVVLLDEDDIREISGIRDSITANKVDHFICVPSLYRALIENSQQKDFLTLKTVTLAGEKIPSDLLEKTVQRSQKLELVNEYGITETTVASTVFRQQQKEKKVIIGTPIWNTRIYILNKEMQLQPMGIAGELCISGQGISRGYLNKPELTHERICDNPFVDGERLYRTGDLARWLLDGQLEYLGRMDHQVKVRGFRIELGEVEKRLQLYKDINDVVVYVREIKQSNRENEEGECVLCACFVSSKTLKAIDLISYLKEELPDNMIPSYFIRSERIPRTLTGKVDRKKLPEPELKSTTEFVGPRDDTERKLVAIWADLLNTGEEKISIDSNFFQVGGHSLKASLFILKLHKEFQVRVPMSRMFQAPTIRGLSKYIREVSREKYISILSVEKKEYYPLSSGQKRIYVQSEMKQGNTKNNVSAYTFKGAFQREQLQTAFQKLINRHESLRTSFLLKEDEPVQKVIPLEELDFSIEYFNLESMENRKESFLEEKKIISNFVRPFDLSKAPLLRVGLIELRKNVNIFLLDTHHIITDGLSNEIFVRELTALFNNQELPGFRVQYKDFSEWQNRMYASGMMRKQEAFWLEEFEGELPVLALPTDFVKPENPEFTGERIYFNLEKELIKKIKNTLTETSATLHMFMLSVYSILLSRYTRQEDIIIGSPITGRNHADLEGIIGMFANVIANRNYPRSGRIYREFLLEVKERSIKAYENQDYPFEELLNKLKVYKDIGRSRLFSVIFGLQNIITPKVDVSDLVIQPYGFENERAHYDLVFQVYDVEGSISMSLVYATELFKRISADKIIQRLIEIMRQVTEDLEIKLEDISISHDYLSADSQSMKQEEGDFGF